MEEAVQMVGSAARAGVDIAAELLKILAPALAKGGLKILGAGGKLIGYGINKAASSIDNAKAAGTVSHANLLVEAAKKNTSVKCTETALPQSATDEIVRLAEEYKIPIAINGNGANHTISYLESDADTFQQILQDWQDRRFAPREGVIPMTTFAVNKNEISAIRTSLERQGVECFFTKSKNGELRCAFNSSDREKVELVKNEYLKCRSEVDKIKMSTDIPETKRQLEIKSQIAELEKARSELSELSPEMRGEAYRELIEERKIEFPVYTDKNIELIHEQMPDAVRVAGKAFWEKHGFQLNDNAKGIEINAPQMDEDGKPILDENGKQAFTQTTVYDISETNAPEIINSEKLTSINVKIDELKSEYKAESARAFAEAENKKVTISDGENNIEINVDKTTHKSDVEALFKENFGYDDVRAELAANKLADEFGLGETYFEPKVEASITQNIDKMMVDIKYSSDDISIRDISFSAVKLKGRENIQIHIANGDEQVLVEPSALSDEELKTVFKEHLGMSELQAEKAVVKARKIDGQIMDRLRETVHTHTGSESLGIERTSSNSFIVKAGEQTKVYDFSQADLERVISEDFKIPAENAKSIISKAKSQSVVQNKIRENTNKKRKEAKLKNDPFKSENRSSKKVTR